MRACVTPLQVACARLINGSRPAHALAPAFMARIATDVDAGLKIIGLDLLHRVLVAVGLSVSVTADPPLGGTALVDVVIQGWAGLEVTRYQVGARGFWRDSRCIDGQGRKSDCSQDVGEGERRHGVCFVDEFSNA